MQISKTTRRWGSATNKTCPLEKSNLHTYPNLNTDVLKWLSALFFENTLIVTKSEEVIGKTDIWCV